MNTFIYFDIPFSMQHKIFIIGSLIIQFGKILSINELPFLLFFFFLLKSKIYKIKLSIKYKTMKKDNPYHHTNLPTHKQLLQKKKKILKEL